MVNCFDSGNSKKNIWVDADACPKVVKQILFRAAVRSKILITLVANKNLYVSPSSFIKVVCVSAGFDVADNYILQALRPNDLVITSDMLLADAVITQNGIVLNPNGKLYSRENIKQQLSIRNFNEQLRNCGINACSPPALTKRNVQDFANYLDQYLKNH